MGSPAGTVMSGPGYGLEHPTHATTFAGMYALYLYVGAALMAILLVVRHTRAEEEDGRLELVLAAEVGRHGPLAVTGVLLTAASLALGLLTTVALFSVGYGAMGSVAIGMGMATVSLVFGAIAMVAAQVVEHSRTAVGLAAVALGAALVLRGAGDVLRPHGSWLSWLSPLAWVQQARPFHEERWWPLLIGVFFAAAMAVSAVRLRSIRDHGAGLVASPRGEARAPRWMRSPFALAFRLERRSMAGWAAALLVLGALYGALTDSVRSSLGDLDNDLLVDALGGDPARLVDGYLAICAMFNAYLALCYALVAMHRLVTEERDGRAALVLSAAVSRTRWLLGGVAAATVGTVVVLVAAGVGMGVTAALATSDAGHLWPVLGGTILHLPAITVLMGIATVGFSVRSRSLGVAWAVAVFAMVVGYLGFALDLPAPVVDLSPLSHIARVPLEVQPLPPILALTSITVVLLVVASIRFRHRDLEVG